MLCNTKKQDFQNTVEKKFVNAPISNEETYLFLFLCWYVYVCIKNSSLCLLLDYNSFRLNFPKNIQNVI